MRWPLSNEATAAIVGDAYVARDPSKTEAYRWTAAGGYQLLGDLGSASSGSAAYAASFDGSVVVGEAPVGTNTFGAFRWTASQGMMALPLPMIFAYAVTDDGTMVAASCQASSASSGWRRSPFRPRCPRRPITCASTSPGSRPTSRALATGAVTEDETACWLADIERRSREGAPLHGAVVISCRRA